MGGSDLASFNKHAQDYGKTLWEFSERFEKSYFSLIKAIRQLAYPKHPEVVHSERHGFPGFSSSTTPASIPIFVMRPLRGELEHVTQNIVSRLRNDGDKAGFWLDTSGWLDPDSVSTEDETGDFVLDDKGSALPRWRLTAQGNQRVAIFLHMHVCRYLAATGEKCAFLPQEVYTGKVYNPAEVQFDQFVEDEKERKLKQLFWADEKMGEASVGLQGGDVVPDDPLGVEELAAVEESAVKGKVELARDVAI